jgi:hypothetical protein
VVGGGGGGGWRFGVVPPNNSSVCSSNKFERLILVIQSRRTTEAFLTAVLLSQLIVWLLRPQHAVPTDFKKKRYFIKVLIN